MKIAAVLVPLAIFLLPTLALIIHIIVRIMRGKDLWDSTYPARPDNPAKARIVAYSIAIAYWLAFNAAISWSVYVFTDEAILSVCSGAVLLVIPAIQLIATRLTRGLPGPPPEGFPDDKAFLEWDNKRCDLLSKNLGKLFIKYTIFVTAVVLLIVVASIIKLLLD